LFTQCSNCDTVFRLSAETLRAAGGQVRCGRCGEIFNALARLAEEPGAFPRRESTLEMEMRADEILQSSPPIGDAAQDLDDESEEDAAGGRQLARLEIIDPNAPPAAPDHPSSPTGATGRVAAPAAAPGRAAPPTNPANPATSAPTTLRTAPPSPAATNRAPSPTGPASSPTGRGPGQGQGSSTGPGNTSPTEPRNSSLASSTEPVRAPSSSKAPSHAPSPPAAQAGTGATAQSAAPKPGGADEPGPPAAASSDDEPGSDPESSFEFTLPPGELDRIFVEVAPRSRSPIPAAALALSEAAVENLAGTASEARSQRVSGFDVSEDVRREMLAGMEADTEAFANLASPAPRRTFFAWLAAAVVLAVLLAGQMLHENRAWVAVHAPLRGPLRGFYAALGIAVQVPATLSAYQLRQWGVTGDPAAAGTLRVRASILNTAAQLQPYPLLRVMLANRFGARIGMRDFEPAEYLGKPTARMLAPGERADATLDIVDPGKDAEGFEIDVCLRGVDQKISCAGDATQQAGAAQGKT
jgi:predicted Zn finger-like uncharacterized protein